MKVKKLIELIKDYPDHVIVIGACDWNSKVSNFSTGYIVKGDDGISEFCDAWDYQENKLMQASKIKKALVLWPED